jgi:GxxExxY protein
LDAPSRYTKHSAPGCWNPFIANAWQLSLKTRASSLNPSVCIKLSYKGVPINTSLRVDLLVDGIIVVELKAIEALHPIHSSQVITYLKLANCPAGLLLNFNVTRMKAGVKRLDHPDLYTQKKSPPPNLLTS